MERTRLMQSFEHIQVPDRNVRIALRRVRQWIAQRSTVLLIRDACRELMPGSKQSNGRVRRQRCVKEDLHGHDAPLTPQWCRTEDKIHLLHIEVFLEHGLDQA